MSRRLLWLPYSLSFLLASSAALASDPFPGVIATTLSLSKAPACTLCHASDAGGKGTVVQPFGRKMMGYGLMSGDTQNLVSILNKMRDTHDDTDQDGVSDIDELKAGTDPNINDITGQPPEDYPPPVYGCRVSWAQYRAPGPVERWSTAGLVLAGAMWMRRRTARRSLGHATERDT
jgi:hypothetical protein